MSATDNVQVTKVLITVLNDERSEGQTLEQYEAVQIVAARWEFETAPRTEGKVIVEAFDLAGNVTK